MRRSVVIRHVIARARRQRISCSMLVFDGQLTCNDKHNVALGTPVVSDIFLAVNDQPELNIPKLLRANHRSA